MKYVCKTTCQFGGRVYHEGDLLETTDKDVPHHFEPVDAPRKQTAKVQRKAEGTDGATDTPQKNTPSTK